MGKIVTKAEFKEKIRPILKADRKKIALCHGVFDLVHAGHITHLEQAKAMADVLVVSITAAEFVRKGPDRPYFNDEQRLKFLSAIEYVDYCMVSEGYTVDDIVEAVEPDYYVKGAEYANEDADVTKNMRPERELVEKHGGTVRYTTGEVFSSTKLINIGLSALPKEVVCFMEDFKKRHNMEEIISLTDKIKDMKVLVIGDVIIDRYTYCRLQGLMSKDAGYSARVNSDEMHLGGSLAIARHLSSFCDNVTLLSAIGNEIEIQELLDKQIADKINTEFVKSEVFPTIIKHRYLTMDAKREEYRKILAVTNIPEKPRYDRKTWESIVEYLKKNIEEFDVVFLCDFGHGLIKNKIRDIVQEKSKYMILNCQTNSSNHGKNIITKYHRADRFSLDQAELGMAFPEVSDDDEDEALRMLCKHLNGKGWLTRGSDGAKSCDDGVIDSSPAFTLSVKDTIGAGDAFYSISGIYAAAGASMETGLFLGNIAGALGANIVGNRESVEKVDVLKFAGTLLNI